jgi:hypothetical protein
MKFEITSADDRHFYLLKFYEILPHKMSHSCQGINQENLRNISVTVVPLMLSIDTISG